MVDFLKRKLMAVTGNYITVIIDENKKIQIEYDEYQKISDLIMQNVREITKDQQQNNKKDKTEIGKQFNVVVSFKDKKGLQFKRVAHSFEMMRDLKEFTNADSVEFEIVRKHNYYADERRKVAFLSTKIDSNDKFYMKGPLDKKSRKDGKFKKKQVTLYKNHIQYISGNKTKIIPLEEIKTVAPSTDQTMKNVFYMLTKQKCDGFHFKAESDINMKKWIFSIQQNLNYFRDLKLTNYFDDAIEKRNREVTQKIQNHTNQLLYRLEDIVKKSYLIKSIYRIIEKNFVRLQKFDKDLLFQVMSINHDPAKFEQNFGYLQKYLTDSTDNPFSEFLKQQRIVEQFNILPEKMLKESRSMEENINNESVDLNRTVNMSMSKYQRNPGRMLSSYQTYSSFTNDTIESKLKNIPNPIEKLNFIFISYMNNQYKSVIKFSEMISKILCNYRTENYHYKSELNVFQYNLDQAERMIPIYKDFQMQQDKTQQVKLDDQDFTPYLHNFILY